MRSSVVAPSVQTSLGMLALVLPLLLIIPTGAVMPALRLPAKSDAGVSVSSAIRSASSATPWRTSIPYTPGPWPRLYGSWAYDSSAGYPVFYGGYDYYANVEMLRGGVYGISSGVHAANDTWTGAGGAWSPIPSAAPQPPPRQFPGLSDDPADGEVVMFGGVTSTYDYCCGSLGVLDDTWVVRGGQWSEVHPALSPPAGSPAMAYDAGDRQVLLVDMPPYESFEGAQTWGFAGGSWTNLTADSSVSPPWLYGVTMASDPAIDGVLMVGEGPEATLETWEFVHGQWSNLTGSAGPVSAVKESEIGFQGEDLGFDPLTGQAFLWFANSSASAVQVWALGTGGSWHVQESWPAFAGAAPPSVVGPSSGQFLFENGSGGGQMMMFGMLGDVWELEGPSWVELLPPAPSLFPDLGLSALPVAGSTFEVQFFQQEIYGSLGSNAFDQFYFPLASAYNFSSPDLPSSCSPSVAGFSCNFPSPGSYSFPAYPTDRDGRTGEFLNVSFNVTAVPGVYYGPIFNGWYYEDIYTLIGALIFAGLLGVGVYWQVRTWRRDAKMYDGIFADRPRDKEAPPSNPPAGSNEGPPSKGPGSAESESAGEASQGTPLEKRPG